LDERVHRTIRTVWSMEAPRLVGGLVRLVRDVDLAEDLAQEALVAALEHWPEHGIPDNPGAWLMTAAKNRAVDEARRKTRSEDKHKSLALESPTHAFVDPEQLDEDVGDDVLRLILVACHPLLSREARVALTLRLLGGLSTEEIARAFLIPEPTVQQRIVRAKRTLQEARVPFEVPKGEALEERLPAILEVLYLVFNEGYSAMRGDAWVRPELCNDALRLGRVLAGLVPDVAEVHGLVALMELQASRFRARQSASGEPVLLLDQDRSTWDYLAIRRGLASLERAQARPSTVGPYTLQAAIAACHARAHRKELTDWHAIVALYDALVEVTGSPVVELNRAVAVAMAYGPEQGLALVDALVGEPVLANYHLLPSVRGDLLARLGRKEAARHEFERAAFLATNTRERALLLRRASEMGQRDEPAP
jgi:RNA polymerase sigma-70 factor, ECF subfamily